MSINSKLVTIVLLLSNFLAGQNKKIQILSENSKLPIQNVEIFNENKLVSLSDEKGYFKTDISNNDLTFFLVKEGYYDLQIELNENITTVYLKEHKVIEIKEIVIKQLTDKEILDSVYNNLINNNKRYKLPEYFKINNSLISETDTLHSLNALLNYKVNDGFYIDKNAKIIKKFIVKKNTSGERHIYNFKNKKIEFWEFLTLSYLKINGQLELSKILNNRNLYSYEIVSGDDKYKIIFKSKKKRNFAFDGYLLVDVLDFGILEFKLNLTDKLNNNIKFLSLDEKTKYSYDILKADYFIKYDKDNSGNYNLVYSSFDQLFLQKNGDFKNKLFEKKSAVESSFNYNNSTLLKFDIFNYN